MKAIKIILVSLLAILIIISPVLFIICGAVMLPDQYDHTFLGILDEKFERLTHIKDEKVILIGGSSVAFGMESRLMERYMDMPVVNLGLYADLGTKLMLDLSLAGVREGDVVVVAPELDPQTLSMYFNSERTLQAMDGSYEMMNYVGSDNIFSLIGAMFGHFSRKIDCMANGAPKAEGVYQSQSFNTYGDIMYTRPKNIMENYYDVNTSIRLDESIVEEAFIEYLNEYVRICESRGARVYFSFCPMNRMALAEGTTEQSIEKFESYLKRVLDCEVISYAEDYIMEEGYFYDSNFHLNEMGARYRTLLLTRDLLLAEGTPTLINTPLPEAPELSAGLILVEGYDENQKYFTYEKMPNGNYKITGLTELGMSAKELTLPISVRIESSGFGAAVTSVGKGAFAGSAATSVYIPEGSYIGIIENRVFSNSSVKSLYILIENPEHIKPPSTQDGGFGNKGTLTVHVPKNSGYVIDYFWGEVPKSVIISEDIVQE